MCRFARPALHNDGDQPNIPRDTNAVFAELRRCAKEGAQVLQGVGAIGTWEPEQRLELKKKQGHTWDHENQVANGRRGIQAPEVQSMYSLNMPVSAIRTKIRQEFERHRYVSQLKTVDVLLFNSHQEYQLAAQETLNYWKQLTHVLKYFRMEEDPKAKLPKTFIQGFLEGRN
ncbi:hypothetical protein LTR17_027422 [Elasticomyces elasticus]|nr:hypothetical protein LTR17_027422 [Elasticomyces elasticus]